MNLSINKGRQYCPRLHLTLAAAVMIALSSSPGMAAEAPTQSAAQKSTASGVTVTVTPVLLASDSSTWDFRVVLDTHSQELNDDLSRTAVLVSSDGKRYTPLAWEGAAPGGHHREGVLKFAVPPATDSVELQIQRPGESTTRTFSWRLR